MLTTKSVVDLLHEDSNNVEIFESNMNLKGIRIALLKLDAGEENAFVNWVVNGSNLLIQYFRHAFSSLDDTRPIAVVLMNEESASDWEEAAREATWRAAKGIIQSLTREKGAKDIRINVIYSNKASENELIETLEYLATSRAGFFAGSSFDLRGKQ